MSEGLGYQVLIDQRTKWNKKIYTSDRSKIPFNSWNDLNEDSSDQARTYQGKKQLSELPSWIYSEHEETGIHWDIYRTIQFPINQSKMKNLFTSSLLSNNPLNFQKQFNNSHWVLVLHSKWHRYNHSRSELNHNSGFHKRSQILIITTRQELIIHYLKLDVTYKLVIKDNKKQKLFTTNNMESCFRFQTPYTRSRVPTKEFQS